MTDEAGKPILLTFRDAAQQVARLKNWHGHGGTDSKNEEDFYQALKEGRDTGKRFVPPSEFLIGID